MLIRKYISLDIKEIAELFYQTVHNINAKDYTEEQLNVWSTGNIKLSTWNESFLKHITYIAIKNNIIVGFGDIDETGYLDRLYVHKEYQRQGIASALCDELEKGFEKIMTHASITAKPFFLSRGYKVIKEQQVIKKRNLFNELSDGKIIKF